MAVVIAAALGAALAFYAVALGNGLAVVLWPRGAFGVLAIGCVAGGIAGIGLASAGERRGEQVRRRSAVLLGCAVLAGLGALAALRLIAADVDPGAGALAFPPWFLALCAAPFAIAAALLVSWLRAGERRSFGWLLAGVGAGCLASAAMAGTQLPMRAPWFGGHALEAVASADGSLHLRIDRGLREIAIAPASPTPLPFLPAPDAGGSAEALLVGLPDGQVFAALLDLPHVRLTVLEEDPALVAAVLRRWPELDAARASGRVRFVAGNPRRSLERSQGRYGLIALAQGQTAEAHRSRALNPRADHLWTVEAFRSYLSRLNPDGYLLAQRAAIGRVVTTLREATDLPAGVFRERVVVFGDRGRAVSQCWYRPAGFADVTSQRAAIHHGVNTGIEVLYRPSKQPMASIYERLVKGERLGGLAFSTPLDLSPTLDERPFFDHVERMTISPSGRALPEEPASPVSAALQIVPPGDRDIWVVMLAGVAAAAALLAAGVRRGHRAAARAHPASALPAALLLGACAACSLEAFNAWVRWLAPSPPTAMAALGGVFVGCARGWLGGAPRGNSRFALPALAGVLLLFALGAYRAAPLAFRLAAIAASALLVAAGALLGVALGRALREAVMRLEARHPGVGGWLAGTAMAAAAIAWPAGRLAATHFGYRLIWALGAVAALAAARNLSRLPAGRGGAPT